MAIYSLALRATQAASGSAIWELRTGANRCLVMEIGYSAVLSTARPVGLGRPTVRGITPTEVVMVPDDPNSPASTVSLSIAWNATSNAAPPLMPTTFLRRATIQDTTATIVWYFPEGLLVPANSSLSMWNVGGGGTADVWVVVDE